MAQATLYRQIKQLHDGGIIEIVAEERGNGAVERTYSIVEGGARLSPEELAGISAEAHIQYFSIFAAGLIDTFSRYVTNAESTPESPADGMSYNRATVYLSDSEREALREQLNTLISGILQQEPSPERKRYTLASVVIPDERNEERNEK
ncbi:MAG: hypothetical protein AAF702_49140 [Chloroflexota bacterium]